MGVLLTSVRDLTLGAYHTDSVLDFPDSIARAIKRDNAIFADFEGLPPLLIQVGDAEVLLDDATRTAERAKSAGVDVKIEVWPEMVHVWHVFAKILPEGQQAIDRIGEFVVAHAN